jgi:ribose transport system substrate-binding protein
VIAANRKGETLVTGMNGVPPALRAVKDGNLALTVELNAFEWGRLGVDMLDRVLKGENVGKQVFIKHRLVDATNVDELLARLPKN